MDGMNQVIVEGRLVKDPEYKVYKDDKALCKFTIAVKKSYKDRKKDAWVEEVSYFLVETWRGLAEVCYKYLAKGRGVRVIGELKQSRWTDPENANKKRDMVYIIADYVEFQAQKKSTEEVNNNAHANVQHHESKEELDIKETVDVLDREASQTVTEIEAN